MTRHLNSIDKDDSGDYLISGRFTSTIYKISGVDGSILWRLGGKRSSFAMVGFNFSAQHDARFHDCGDLYGDATTCISLLNNAAGGPVTTSDYSMGLLIALDTKTMTASLVQEYSRPDHSLTVARGNMQILPNTNVLMGWSENAKSSEFTADGRLVAEASFTSNRFVTYRAYKFNFISRPAEPPTMKAFRYGASPSTTTCAFHVSWNGATEVRAWRFFARTRRSSEFSLVATVKKRGFETTGVAFGYQEEAFAEAVAENGTALGRSAIEVVNDPPGWLNDREHASENPRASSAHATSNTPGTKGVQAEKVSVRHRLVPISIHHLLAGEKWEVSEHVVFALCCALILLAISVLASSLRARSWCLRPFSMLQEQICVFKTGQRLGGHRVGV